MDMLRSAYRSQMRTIIGADPVTVQWYRTPPGAAVQQATTSFRSRIWSEPKDNDGIGEQADTLSCCGKFQPEWVNGFPPTGHSTGPAPCGSALVAIEGAGALDPKFVTNGDGSSSCCNPPLDCPPRVVGAAGFGRWSFDGNVWKSLVLGAPDVWNFFTTAGLQQVVLFCGPGATFFMTIQGQFTVCHLDTRIPGYAKFTVTSAPGAPVYVGTTIEWSWPSHP